jgi:hypothetical protein
MPNKAKWTVLTYIAAHNNLDWLGNKSRQEILEVGSTTDVVHGVLYDGKAGAARCVMGNPGVVDRQDPLGDFDSGDPDGLIATAKWLFEKHPAERYGLVLWSHGTGWEPGEIEEVAKEARPGAQADAVEAHERSSAPGSLCLFRSTLRAILQPDKPAERAILFDDGTGHSLDTLELARVAGAIAEFIGQPLELLGMDACLMGNIEVAYELRKAVRYLVASEELVPGHSWPYKEIFGALLAKPNQNSADFARLVVDRYVDFYTANPPGAGDVTKVALDLSRIEQLVHATKHLADALRNNMNKVSNVLWQVQRSTQQHETQNGKRQPNKFYYHLWDLGSLAAGLVGSDEAPDPVKQAAAGIVKAISPGTSCVLEERHRGSWFDGIGGASVYLMPPGQQRISPSYSKLSFAKDSQWGLMLSTYRDHVT